MSTADIFFNIPYIFFSSLTQTLYFFLFHSFFSFSHLLFLSQVVRGIRSCPEGPPTHYPPAMSKVATEVLLFVHKCECAYA